MKRLNIVLYNPQAVFYDMPLALLCIASALDPDRFRVQIIDARLEPEPLQTLLEACSEALCLGITVLTGKPTRDALTVSREVKKRFPDLPIIWGGWHPSLFPKQTLRDEAAIDITVQGQGEVTFVELADCLAAKGDPSTIKGISYRRDGEIVQNPPRPITDMNLLPEVNYQLIPVERYFELKGQRQLDYISSTGCHFRCSFCADPFVFKRNWTGLNPERMGREIQKLHDRYQFDDLNFQDETFFTYRQRILGIAQEFCRIEGGFSWAGTMRADQGSRLKEEDFVLCARSGLRRVLIGVESGSQEMMDWLNKDIKLEQVLLCAERCKRHQIAVIFPFIVGFPGESRQSVRATMDLVKRLRRMSPRFETPIFYFKPYPGSKITDEVTREGYRLPQTIEEWGEFDYIGSSGPWVSKEKLRLIERFKFYNRIAWGTGRRLYWPFRQLARWRCRHDFYQFPLEKLIADKLKPLPKLS